MTRRTLLLALPLAAAAGGCGGTPTGTVSGTVRYKGKPLKGGTITFAPKTPTDTAQQVTLPIEEDGTYISSPLAYGEWLVGVQPARTGDETTNKPTNPSQPPPPKPAPPAWVEKYADPLRSGLTVTVGEPTKAFPVEMN